METAVVVPAFINDPKPGKKAYSIKDNAGTYWYVMPEHIHLFQKGKATPVQYEASEFNGKVFYWVKGADGAQPAPAAPQPVAAYAPQPPQHSPAAAEQTPQDMAIFVTGIVGRAMQSGQFGIDAIEHLTNAAMHAWIHKRAVPWGQKPVSNELNDEVPF